MKIPDSLASKPEAAQVLSILEGLDQNAPGAEVFEAFEQLDDLPADVVRAVLTTWTGPAPDAALLEPALREAHGLPVLPLALRCARVVRPVSVDDLGPAAQRQVRRTGVAWDGRDLSAELRLANDGGESSFRGSLELKTFVDAAGSPRFDVVLHGAADEASGAIFAPGRDEVRGAVAYGIVELNDRAARMGLQSVLTAEPDPAAAILVSAAEEAAPSAAPPSSEPPVDSVAETPRLVTRKQLALFREEEPATERLERPARKKAAATAKKTAAAPKKTAAKSATSKKKTAAPSKKTAAATKASAPKKKAAASKKTTAPASKKTAAASKKSAVAPASKKTAAASKKSAVAPASKKTASKKAAAAEAATAPAKKATSKKTAAAAPASKKSVSPKKTAAARAPASKKKASSKRAAPDDAPAPSKRPSAKK